MRVSIAPKPFLHGLLVAALVYILIAGFIWMKGPATMAKMESGLATLTAPIERVVHVAAVQIEQPLPTVDLDAAVPAPPAAPETPAVVPPAPVAENLALPAAPLEGLYQTTATGPLPQKKGALSPFEAYRRPFKVTGQPVIALIVDDYGLSESVAQKAIDILPPDVSFMLSPYSSQPQKWADDARKAGHEFWMKVNFETASYPNSDPGPQTLLANASLKYNQDLLIWHLTRASGYAGVSVGTDYIFESASSILQPLVKYIFNHGLGFFESNAKASPMIEAVAVSAQAPYAKTDTIVNESVEKIEGAFQALEKTAQERGYAIGIIKPYGASFEQIKGWVDGLKAKGIVIAPVSAIEALPLNQPAEMEETEPAPSAEAP